MKISLQTPALSTVNEGLRFYSGNGKAPCDTSSACKLQINAEPGIQKHQKTTNMVPITPENVRSENTRNLRDVSPCHTSMYNQTSAAAICFTVSLNGSNVI